MVALSNILLKKNLEQPRMCDENYHVNENLTSSEKLLLILVIGVAMGCVLASICVLSLLIVKGLPPCAQEEMPIVKSDPNNHVGTIHQEASATGTPSKCTLLLKKNPEKKKQLLDLLVPKRQKRYNCYC